MLTTIALLATTVGGPVTFGDWMVVCDNGARCTATAAGEGPLDVTFVREPGPDSMLEVELDDFNNVEGRKVTILLGDNKTDVEFVARRTKSSPTSWSWHAAFQPGHRVFEELRLGDSISLLEKGSDALSVSTEGLEAAFVYMDAEQGRLHNESALAVRGDISAAKVPTAPALPIITVPPFSNKPPTRLTDTEIARQRASYSCEREYSRAETGNKIDYVRLDDSNTLALLTIECMAGATNSSERVMLVDNAGNVRLPNIEYGSEPDDDWAEALPGAYWDAADQMLVTSGRASLNCGGSTQFAWDGEKFRRAKDEWWGACDVGPTPQVTTWRAEIQVRPE
jgi:Protein of unknown function (DUF1176)